MIRIKPNGAIGACAPRKSASRCPSFLKFACPILASFLLYWNAPAFAASTFYFQFDNQGFDFSGDGPLVPPIVGSGTFVSPIDLSPGTYDLSGLSGFSLTINFIDGSFFTASNIATPLTGAAVRIENAGGGAQRLFFTEGSGEGADGGPFSGALDLLADGPYLSFEPSNAGGNFLYYSDNFAGRYRAISGAVPEPATWAMMVCGIAAIGVTMRPNTIIRTRSISSS